MIRKIKKLIWDVITTYHPVMRSVPFDLRKHAWRRVAVSEKGRFIYIRIPKAANSTISKTLYSHVYLSDDEKLKLDDIGKDAKNKFDNLLQPKCFTENSIYNNYFIFSFFRNPYSRILSTYLDKFQSDFNHRKYQWVAKDIGVTLTKDITFSDFIDYIAKGNINKDAHWAPQISLCPFPLDKLNFIGKVETIDSDLPFVMERLFGRGSFKGIEVREHNRQHAIQKLNSFYTEELIRRVYDLYKKDFECLGYAKSFR